MITVGTFENFTYTVNVGTKTNDNFPMTVTVAAELPKERTPGKDEKKEDKEKLDKEFADKHKKDEEKLAQEKQYEKWTYLVSSWSVDSLLKNRSELMAEKKTDSTNQPPASASSPGPVDNNASTVSEPIKLPDVPVPAPKDEPKAASPATNSETAPKQ